MTHLLRREKLTVCGTALLSWWALMATVLPVAYSQPVPTQPVPRQPAPTMTPTEAERAREAERLRQAERARTAEPETIVEHKRVRPSETYVAGYGGYTFAGKFTDVDRNGLLFGGSSSDRDLANSGVYGGKLGHFFGDRLDWLGVEMEANNTTPHVEQQGQIPGSHLRVTTLAFNLIGRLKFGCETKTERTETRTEKRAGTRTETRMTDGEIRTARDPKGERSEDGRDVHGATRSEDGRDVHGATRSEDGRDVHGATRSEDGRDIHGARYEHRAGRTL